MIDKDKIEQFLMPHLAEEHYFLVEVSVKPNNRVVVFIDSARGVSIEYCSKVSRLLEAFLDRDIEDFELEVSSPGIGKPFKVMEQYHKAVEMPVEVLTHDGLVVKGVLKSVDEQGFSVQEEKMVRRAGKKSKKELQITSHRFSFEAVKSVKERII